MSGVRKSREPSRWHTNTRGHYPSLSPTNKIKARLAQGAGEAMAVQRAANRLFRTKAETAPVPRRIYTPAQVVQGLGLPNADQQQVQRLVSDIPADWNQKMQTQRIFLARGRLVETLRSMKHIPSDTRQELVKRAGAYWRTTMQTDYGKAPTIRFTARKSLSKAGGPYIGPKGGKWADPKHTKPWREPFAKRKLASGETLIVGVDGMVSVNGKAAGIHGALKTSDERRLFAGEAPSVNRDELQYLAMAVRRAKSPGEVRKRLSKILDDAGRLGAAARQRAFEERQYQEVNRAVHPGKLYPARKSLSKAKKGEATAGSHKYESRKPDGHGGWLYKYPGQAGWSAGKGDHEGKTKALPGEHLDPHHDGYQPSVERHAGGGFTLHAGEGISSPFKPGMSLDDHKDQWDHHKAAHDKAKEAGNHHAMAAHKHALQAHAQAHNMKQEKMKGGPQEAPGGPDSAGKGKPPTDKGKGAPEPQGGAQGPQGPNPAGGNGPPPAMGAPGGDQQGGANPPSTGPQAAEQPVGPDGQPQPTGPNGEPMSQPQQMGEADALADGRTRHTEPHPDVQAVQQAVAQATKVMGDMVAAHMHTGELKDRIKAVKADKSLPRSMRKRLVAQHEAEIAAAKADQAMLEEQHDTVMAEVKRAQQALDKPHPLLQKLLKLFAAIAPKPDADTKDKQDKGIDPHDGHRDRRGHQHVAEEQQAQQMAEAAEAQAQMDNGGGPSGKGGATQGGPPMLQRQQGRPAMARSLAIARELEHAAGLALDELRKAYTPRLVVHLDNEFSPGHPQAVDYLQKALVRPELQGSVASGVVLVVPIEEP